MMSAPAVPSAVPSSVPAAVRHVPPPVSQTARLREAAVAIEASFLREMLAAAGLGRVPSAFGGGEGEGQFASFLLEAQARHLAEAGGVGLAESILRGLTAAAAAGEGGHAR